MATRPKGYGLTSETKNKIDSKYDDKLAGEALDWIKKLVPDAAVNPQQSSASEVHAALKDGRVLCKLANAVRPGHVRRINEGQMAFKQMENINNFLQLCEAEKLTPVDMFQTVDLFENQNMAQVVTCLHALGRKVQKIHPGMASIGAKEASENKREFTAEQLRSGEAVIGLQAGSNKGASQAGQNFGKTRSIMD